MSETVELFCSWCRNSFEIPAKEYRRQIKKGRTEFFCGLSCGAYASNLRRPHKERFVEVECEFCHKKFMAPNKESHKYRFCCRSHASAGSMSEERRAAMSRSGICRTSNLNKPFETLRKREAWKYRELKDWLVRKNVSFLFEFPVGGYVFDLAILSRKLLIEFDGKYHESGSQKAVDDDKDCAARGEGWEVVRVVDESNGVIPVSILEKLNI